MIIYNNDMLDLLVMLTVANLDVLFLTNTALYTN